MPWTKRTSTGGNRFRTEAFRYEVEHGSDLLATRVELLYDHVNTESSRFSMIVATGKRVPLNTLAPLTLPRMLSTTRHRDQSRAATRTPWLQITAKSRAGQAGSSDGSETVDSPQPALQPVPTRENALTTFAVDFF